MGAQGGCGMGCDLDMRYDILLCTVDPHASTHLEGMHDSLQAVAGLVPLLVHVCY